MWKYMVNVPNEKSGDFIICLMKLGLFDDEYLEVIEEGVDS